MLQTFYVGDLCYVLTPDEWERVCYNDDFYPGEDYDPQDYLDYEKTYDDDDWAGRPYWILKTAYGDGCYQGCDGNSYCVDSGTIGCIRVTDVSDPTKLENAIGRGIGHLIQIECDDPCEVAVGYDCENEGTLYFDALNIYTAGEDEDDYETEEDEED